jgi:transposase
MVLTSEDKVIIEALRTKGLGAVRIVKEYPDRGWKVRTVNDFLKKLEETGSRDRKPGSGRPRSVRTEEMIASVEERILSQENKPGSSMSEREVSRDLGISRSSVKRIVKKDLKLKTYKRVPVQELSDPVRLKRIERCTQLMRRFAPQDVGLICFTDEKLFTVATPRNTQNDRVHSTATKKKFVPRENLLRVTSRCRDSVMVSIGIMMDHKCSLVFLPCGMRISADIYQQEILERMLPETGRMVPNFVFQQDGAPAHTARTTLAYLRQRCQFIEPSMWPPCSPDLNPLDYYLWSALMHKVYKGAHITNVDELRARITAAWEDIKQEEIAAAIAKWHGRLQAVIDAEGGHIEQFR